MSGLANEVRFAFQPLVNIRTGAIVAVEALPRPSNRSVRELFGTAARSQCLAELDATMASSAVAGAQQHETLLPLHINLFAGTVAYERTRLEALHSTLEQFGRRPHDVTLELGSPFTRLDRKELRRGVADLRERGYRIAVDGVGDGDTPLTLINDLPADTVKLDKAVVAGLPAADRLALVESMQHLCESAGARLAATGVDNEHQLETLRSAGVRVVQGDLLASAARRPPINTSVAGVAAEAGRRHETRFDPSPAGPRVTDFLSPATALPSDATAEDVRKVLADHPEISGVVLVDEQNRPQASIDRNRFLLAVTGPYGHALHAGREASRLADEPRVLSTAATAIEALSLITGAEQHRIYDDAIVVDDSGRCLGTARAGHLIKGMAQLQVEEAAALNPLTRLPSSEAIEREVTRKIGNGEVFAVSWLDVDGFKTINDSVGFSAADELIRSIGRSLNDAATSASSVQVGHVGGDDFLLIADLDDLVTVSETVLAPQRSAGGRQVTLSLATLVCTQSGPASYNEVSLRLAPLKSHAKSLHGSSWVMSRPESDRVDILRGLG